MKIIKKKKKKNNIHVYHFKNSKGIALVETDHDTPPRLNIQIAAGVQTKIQSTLDISKSTFTHPKILISKSKFSGPGKFTFNISSLR